MPRSKRGRSAPDYDSDHEDHLAASDDDEAVMDDEYEEALSDDEEEEVFEECEEMDEDEDDDIDRCADGGEDETDQVLLGALQGAHHGPEQLALGLVGQGGVADRLRARPCPVARRAEGRGEDASDGDQPHEAASDPSSV